MEFDLPLFVVGGDLGDYSLVARRRLLLRLKLALARGSSLETLSHPSCCCLCRGVPDSFVAQNVGGELSLSLGQRSSSGAVVAVDLGKHEEVGKGSNGKADSDAQNKEADKIGAASCLLVCECADCSDNASTSGARNTKGHYAGEHELAKENEEEQHEVEAGVVAEGLVGGSEPAEEGEGDEEEAVDETQAEHRAFVKAGEEEANAAEKIGDHEEGVEQPEVVQPLHHLLELHGDVHIDILVEAGLAGQKAG